ncbi:MAG: GGDEF domain-containing protein, partial [Verrucomicrobiae bacterium]|nr:GGDEF domain-containing protein [Verrucomicrobiae bacterium]
ERRDAEERIRHLAYFDALTGLPNRTFVKELLEHQLASAVRYGRVVAVLFLGIIYAFRQVIRLYPEIRFVNGFRISDPGLSLAGGAEPRLLAPMATMLRDRKGALSLSTTAMRTIMDSIGSRLDEARDTGRYLVGLLVFLGLLGTFWGLLDTITSVSTAISTLDGKGGETAAVFDELKAGLAAPLRGMGTAFSSSLLGLAGSLVLGFLELQASHAHNRFYNELEEWLSGITELTPASGINDEGTRRTLIMLDGLTRAITALTDKLETTGTSAQTTDEHVKELARGVNTLVTQMRTEQKVVREWLDEHAQQQVEVAQALRQVATDPNRRS